MSDIVCKNSDISQIQPNAFLPATASFGPNPLAPILYNFIQSKLILQLNKLQCLNIFSWSKCLS